MVLVEQQQVVGEVLRPSWLVRRMHAFMPLDFLPLIQFFNEIFTANYY